MITISIHCSHKRPSIIARIIFFNRIKITNNNNNKDEPVKEMNKAKGPFTHAERVLFKKGLSLFTVSPTNFDSINTFKNDQQRFGAISRFMGTRSEETVRTHYNMHIRRKEILETAYSTQ